MVDWLINNIEWVIILIFLPSFLKDVFFNLIPSLRNTKNDGSDDDPGGNDNIKRNFHDYM